MITQRPVHFGDVVRNAIVFNMRNQRESLVSTDALLRDVSRLFDLLHERQIDYLLVGGIAMLHYVEGRNTEDINLIVALTSLRQLPEIDIDSQDNSFAQGKFQALQIDFLLSGNPLFAEVQHNYATVQAFTERDIPCATVEGLMLLKLYALPSLYRQGNFMRVGLLENDIASLIQAYQPDFPLLFEKLDQHLNSSDMGELQTIVAEIQQRVERFRRGVGPASLED